MPFPADGFVSGRRSLLQYMGAGLGSIALADLLTRDGFFHSPALAAATSESATPWRVPARCSRVVWFFMSGGPSQVDTFDPKPALVRMQGKEFAGDKGGIGTPGRRVGVLMPSPLRFQAHGKSGLEISELFPKVAAFADDLCVVRSIKTDSAAHGSACLQANLGTSRVGSPSLGSWLSHGLASLSESFPSFVVMHDPRGGPNSGSANWSSGYLSSIHRGTVLRSSDPPLFDLASPPGVDAAGQKRLVDYLETMNRQHAANRGNDAELLSRIDSYQSAYRLQSEAAQLVEINGEPKELLGQYGIDAEPTAVFGRQCLIARRLLEKGVRFVQIYSGAGSPANSWDGHTDCAANHRQRALETDQPIAAFLADLKRTGLWDETLVVWMGEFGRTPTVDGYGKLGRDHNPHGFVAWFAGGGVKGGQAIGSTDELGLKAVESPYHVSDVLGTILYHVGIDPDQLRRDRAGAPTSLFGRDLNLITSMHA